MASWDEDSITLAVEAARNALPTEREIIGSLYFATSTAPFADRQNAAVIAGALQLGAHIRTSDHGGSQRAGTTALLAALDAVQVHGSNALVTAADRRKTPAASMLELQIGDAGAALVIEPSDGVARYLGGGSSTIDFVDHYRSTDRPFDYQWEERWVRDEGVRKIIPQTIKQTLQQLAIDPASIAHFIFPTTIRGADVDVARATGIAKERVRSNLADRVGDCGVAHPLLMLVSALEDAKPGERILVAAFGQGCDVLVFEATDSIHEFSPPNCLKNQILGGRVETNYMKYLVFNDLIEWDRGKRAERDRQTALTTTYRNREMLTALVGGECRQCGTRQFPRVRICVNPNCRALDSQADYSFADKSASVTSWSGDHLVFTLDPPLHYGMVSFAEGGRILVEFADCDPGEIDTGVSVRMAFRIKDFDQARGFRRYFWKAVPERSPVEER